MTELDLQALQGNILRGYGKLPAVMHVFGRLDERDSAKWRSFLGEKSAQLTAATEREPGLTFNLGLSHRALARLRPDLARELAGRFPAFASGMPSRARELGDGGEFERSWQERDVWISIHGADARAVRAAAERLEADSNVPLSDDGLPGEALIRDGSRYEHFGFRDDISWPAVEGTPNLRAEEVAGRGKYDAEKKDWQPIATGEFLLGHADETGSDALEGLSDAARCVLENATFGVIRRLQQHVVQFRRYVSAARGELSREFVVSRMMGRLPDGTPLAEAQGLANFTYEGDERGARCPLGAHVRRVNPRTDGRHRMIRRGVTYGRPLAEGEEDGADRGIWFVAYNASIEDQFEFVQKQWINAAANGAGVGNQGQTFDPITGSGGSRAFVLNGDASQSREPRFFLDIPQFVTCRGGQYYLVPTRTGLEALCAR